MSPFRVLMVRMLRPFIKEFMLNAPFELQALSRNRPFLRKALQSTKVGTFLDANGAVCFIDACKLIQEEASKFRYPFLILTGELDTAINNATCHAYMHHCTSLDRDQKECEHFKGMGHELHRDNGKEQVTERVLKYFARRLASKSEGYQKPKDFRHGFVGARKHSFKYRVFRVIVLAFIVIKVL
jgi:alpha-beta hydrolase superfamily lysophospholipase